MLSLCWGVDATATPALSTQESGLFLNWRFVCPDLWGRDLKRFRWLADSLISCEMKAHSFENMRIAKHRDSRGWGLKNPHTTPQHVRLLAGHYTRPILILCQKSDLGFFSLHRQRWRQTNSLDDRRKNREGMGAFFSLPNLLSLFPSPVSLLG